MFLSSLTLFLTGCSDPDIQQLEEGLTQGEEEATLTLMFTLPDQDTPPRLVDTLLLAIEEAEESIDLAIYDFDLEPIADALLEAIERGVEVRLATDGDELDESGTVLLTDAGVSISYRNPGSHIMHHKFAIFDRSRVWTGSTNWTETGISMNNNNALLIESVTLSERFQEEFDQLHSGVFGRSKEDGQTEASISLASGGSLSAWFSPQDDAADHVVESIESAQESITFMVFSFTRTDVRDALIEAQERGVVVQGIFDTSQASGSYSKDEDLAAAGVPVYLDGNTNSSGWAGGKLHHKVLIVDPATSNERVITGSMNWSNAGNDDNDENLILLENSGLGMRFQTEFCLQLAVAELHEDYSGGEVPDLCEERSDGHPRLTWPPPDDPCPAVTSDPRQCVLIQEFLADPEDTDRGQEFVELYNSSSTQSVDLEGWSFGDAYSDTRHVFTETVLGPGEGLVLFDQGDHSEIPNAILSTSTYLSLNNAGDTLSLWSPEGELLDQVIYESSTTGVSWNRVRDGLGARMEEPWELHSSLRRTNLEMSPGTLATGEPFPGE